ncbi:hypothetical protein [Haloferula sp. A504]|uniref:hypothetical protein n=1 Tax=Haloferula sp. A504 TaxID=3373601 RepID=UPI0031CB241C|nr:c-type cytochrome [Verrucomicrobiaceae bacterium E54]
MPGRPHFFLTALGLVSGALAAPPAIPGFHGKHPLDAAGQGSVLIEELRCASCHDGMGDAPPLAGPRLNGLADRLDPGFIRKFIAAPSAHDPGTRMPDLLHGLEEEERSELADSLTAYLLAPGKSEKAGPPGEADAKRGGELFHEVGCVACHSPKSGDGKPLPGDVGLGHVGSKYQLSGLAEFLHHPLTVRPAGRMPDLGLQKKEAEAIAAFLVQASPAAGEPTALPKRDDARIAAGRKAFFEMRCVACHEPPSVEADFPKTPSAPAAGPAMRLDQGCLSAMPESAPDYQLSDEQREMIRAALKAASEPVSADERVKRKLTQLNCIACHQRDDFGGVHPDRDAYFGSTEEALGNESRIPPQLTLVGAKLRREWLNKVLYNGERVRPYMLARMPVYGEVALEGLPDHFAEVDHLEPLEYPPLDRESGPMIRNGGHLLVGNKGLNCIACHNFNGKEGPGMKGIDLMTTYQRLQPAWFDMFMRAPSQVRPGIIMPSFWPGGQAVQTEILEGDTEEQLRALYHYFSLGRSARDPDGLKAEDSSLVVEDETRVYRGRSRVAGYRGIAVGHPGGLNFAFNAQNGTLSAIWKGEFVRVNWRGQGAGDFNPVGRPVQMTQDVSLLAEPMDPWPAMPVRTKEAPANPDPLYPRQYGYAFKGYSLDDSGVPTFRYHSGKVAITDIAVPETSAEGQVLRRTLSFETGEPATLYFRALTGSLEQVSPSVFQTPKLQLAIHEMPSDAGVSLRTASGGEDSREVIVKIPLSAGSTNLILDYALRD